MNRLILAIFLLPFGCDKPHEPLVQPLPLTDPSLGQNDVRKLVAGAKHACALINGGAVYCWGENGNGQLGVDASGERVTKRTPTRISRIDNAVDIAAGASHTCVVNATGGVDCWGDDGSQRGTWAVKIDGARRIAAGDGATCVVADGIYCWGRNNAGQVPGSTEARVRTPFKISDVPVTAIIGNQATFVARTANDWIGWGTNKHELFKDGNGVRDVAATIGEPLTLTDEVVCTSTTEEVLCYGKLEEKRRSKTPDPKTKTTEKVGRKVDGLKTASAIAIGQKHGCAIEDATAKCWGLNRSGQLGDGTTANRSRAEPVTLSEPVSMITSGRNFSCAASRAKIWCWGNNDFGQIGDGQRTNRWAPVSVVIPR